MLSSPLAVGQIRVSLVDTRHLHGKWMGVGLWRLWRKRPIIVASGGRPMRVERPIIWFGPRIDVVVC